jgi:hypothetical protein
MFFVRCDDKPTVVVAESYEAEDDTVVFSEVTMFRSHPIESASLRSPIHGPVREISE